MLHRPTSSTHTADDAHHKRGVLNTKRSDIPLGQNSVVFVFGFVFRTGCFLRITSSTGWRLLEHGTRQYNPFATERVSIVYRNTFYYEFSFKLNFSKTKFEFNSFRKIGIIFFLLLLFLFRKIIYLISKKELFFFSYLLLC
jgi:hypothetical protein